VHGSVQIFWGRGKIEKFTRSYLVFRLAVGVEDESSVARMARCS